LETELVLEFESKLKLIPYNPEEDLREMEQLERDVMLLSEIMKEFGCAVEQNGENLQKIEETTHEIIGTIEKANEEMEVAHKTYLDTVATKLGIATIVLIGINTPIGVALGVKICLTTLAVSGIGAGWWVYKT
jgi:t-SNARE complex subunit (syntaxin)